MLANWALKCYFEMQHNKEDFSTTFTENGLKKCNKY